MMLPESPSDDTRVQPSCKRVSFDTQSNEASDNAIPPTGHKTPLEAAMAAAITYVETLHNKLQPFLTDLIRQVLKDASIFHYKNEKLKEIVANPEYVPAICRTVGMKLQAVSEVTKSTGFKALEDELAEAIEATRRDWAMRFVLPIFDMNVKALERRFQLSYCRLLPLAAKGFIAQVGTEGYDANVAIMDLLTMHGTEVIAPLNVTPHDFLVLLKEASGMTSIPLPTVEHSMTELLDKINGKSPTQGYGQEDGSSSRSDTALADADAAAAAQNLTEQLITAESAVTKTASHLDLMRKLADQASTAAAEATRSRASSHETLAAARRARATAIDDVDIATANEAQCIAELNAADMDASAATKNQLALGVKALLSSATCAHNDAVNALKSLRERMANENTPAADKNPIRPQGMALTPRSVLTDAITPPSARPIVTPGSIIPGNEFRRASSLRHAETTAAIQNINTVAVDTQLDTTHLATSLTRERATIINALALLIDDGVTKPLQAFHTHIANNAQARRIMKATNEPMLDQAAARIAAVVEAERPANRPTLKGLIHDDVDKTTEELRRRVQSLEAKLDKANSILEQNKRHAEDDINSRRTKKAKNVMGDDKRLNKTQEGTAVAPPAILPTKSKHRKWTATKDKRHPTKKSSPTSLAGNDNASTAANKQSKKRATSHNYNGKGKKKPTVAHN
jgi:hypothetical protein